MDRLFRLGAWGLGPLNGYERARVEEIARSKVSNPKPKTLNPNPTGTSFGVWHSPFCGSRQRGLGSTLGKSFSVRRMWGLDRMGLKA